MTPTGIQQAVTTAGTQQKLADALGVSQQAVGHWLAQGWVPLARARQIESLYGVPRGQLISPRLKMAIALAFEA